MLMCVTRVRRAAPSNTPDSIGELDFIAGTYTLNGVSLTAADVVSHPSYITASGLKCTDFPTYSDGKSVDIIGDFLTAMLTSDFTILVEWEELFSTGMTVPLSMQNGDWSHVFQIQRRSSGGYGLVYDKTSGLDERDVDTQYTSPVVAGLTAGVHKIAATREDSRLRAAVDGNGPLYPVSGTDTTQTGFSALTASVGGFSGDFTNNDLYLRRLKLYTAQSDDSVLAELSA